MGDGQIGGPTRHIENDNVPNRLLGIARFAIFVRLLSLYALS